MSSPRHSLDLLVLLVYISWGKYFSKLGCYGSIHHYYLFLSPVRHPLIGGGQAVLWWVAHQALQRLMSCHECPACGLLGFHCSPSMAEFWKLSIVIQDLGVPLRVMAIKYLIKTYQRLTWVPLMTFIGVMFEELEKLHIIHHLLQAVHRRPDSQWEGAILHHILRTFTYHMYKALNQ